MTTKTTRTLRRRQLLVSALSLATILAVLFYFAVPACFAISDEVVENPSVCINDSSVTLSKNYYGKIYSIISERQTTNRYYTGVITITGSGKTMNTIYVGSGSHDILLDGVNIDVSQGYNDCAFKINDKYTDNVNIILADDSVNILKSGGYCAGLQKNGYAGSAELNISGEELATGKLIVQGGKDCAGIGGISGGIGSKITINSGNIEATGGQFGAGIGGGRNSFGIDIAIKGGSVIAQGGEKGAGIGGGSSGDGRYGSGSKITVSGGTVKAQGGENGAGIGGGDGGNGSEITVSGGTVETQGGNYGAGIGGGCNGAGNNITISGSDVKTTGGESGAGIGGGFGGEGGQINITSGPVVATGGQFGAGIGGGDCSDGREITISGGDVKATGGELSAGIGGGNSGAGQKITVSGGTVKAQGGENGAGIGGGFDESGSEITINSGTVIAQGGEDGAGIGGGFSGVGSNITVNGGSVRAQGGEDGAAIGGFCTEPVTPVNSSGQAVYPTTISVTDIADEAVADKELISLTVPELGYEYSMKDVKTNSEGNIFVYLPENKTVTKATDAADTEYYGSIISGRDGSLKYCNVSISDSSLYFRETNGSPEYSTNQQDWRGYTGSLIISGKTTSNTINIESGSHDLTFDGVNIDVAGTKGTAAFKIADGSKGNVTVMLSDGSVNVLKSGRDCAGLQKNGTAQASGTLTIKSDNLGTGKLTATGGVHGAGIGSGLNAASGNITINSGYISAQGGVGGAGIGGVYGDNGDSSNISINGGTVVAQGGTYGAGIGGGEGHIASNISINGGSVKVRGGDFGADIGSGAAYGGVGEATYLTGASVTPVNDDGEKVYRAAITVNDADSEALSLMLLNSLTVDSLSYTYGMSGVQTDSEGKIYVYLPENKTIAQATDINAVSYSGAIATYNEAVIGVLGAGAPEVAAVENPSACINDSSLYFREDSGIRKYRTTNRSWTPYSGVFTITGSGEVSINTVYIEKGSHDILLDGVNIDASGVDNMAAIKIADDNKGDIAIILKDDSENSLISGERSAGIQKSCTTGIGGELNIKGDTDGTGSLFAQGGGNGAGIGGGAGGKGSNITISGGSVKAESRGNGAGIGGGDGGAGSDINVKGGLIVVYAGGEIEEDDYTVEVYGAGIGGGNKGSGSNITISGGSVMIQNNGYGAGIGGGSNDSGSDITISGGTVKVRAGIFKPNGKGAFGLNGAGIGGGYRGSGSNITISGGSVDVLRAGGSAGEAIGNGNGMESDNKTKVNDYNGEMACLVTLTIKDKNGKALADIELNSLTLVSNNVYFQNNYGMKDVKANSEGNIFVYLPYGCTVTQATDTAGTEYYGSVYVMTGDSGVGISGSLQCR